MITAPDGERRNTLGITPLVYLPTAHHHAGSPLNAGENRWRVLLQEVHIHHFPGRWALDQGTQAARAGRNDDYGAARASLRKQACQEYQAHRHYRLDELTLVPAGRGVDRRVNCLERLGPAHLAHVGHVQIHGVGEGRRVDSGPLQGDRPGSIRRSLAVARFRASSWHTNVWFAYDCLRRTCTRQ